MKRDILIYACFLTAVLLLIGNPVMAQNYEASKTLNKSMNVPSNVVVDMKNHSGDLKFVIGDDNAVSIKTVVHVNARSEEDANKLMDAIEKFEFELSGNRMNIDTRFYNSMNSINNRTTMVLIDKEKIHLKDFEISHEVHIPKSAELELENKYSDLTLPDMEKEVKLNLYSGKMNASDFGGDVELNAKYSRISAGNFMAETHFELYDTDVDFKSAKDLQLHSKYSKVEADKAGNIKAESYDDKFYIDELGSLTLNAKYSDLESEASVNDLQLDLYDCEMSVRAAQHVSFNGKYSKLKLGNVTSLKIDDVYDSNLTFANTGQIEIGKSKYSEFYMDENSKFNIDDSYDDNVQIGKLASGFSGVSVNGKYTKLSVDAGSVPFKVDVAMKYGKVNLPSSLNMLKHIEKDSNLEIEGGSGSAIFVRGYDNTVTVK